VTILLTSHNLAEVETLCARVAILSRGSIRALDTPKNLRDLTSGSETVHITVSSGEKLSLTRQHYSRDAYSHSSRATFVCS